MQENYETILTGYSIQKIIKNNSKTYEKNNGLLKLCLLKEISFKLSDDNIKELSEFISFIMRKLKSIYIKYINDSREEIEEVLRKEKGNNIINISDFIDETLNMEQINELMDFLNLIDKTKINDIKLNLSEYNEQIKLFNESLEQAKRKSIFEFSITSLILKKREDFDKFNQERKNCPDRIDRLLFHAISIQYISSILTGLFRKARITQHGKGVYFTDFLDYCCYYGSEQSNRQNFGRIPKIGDNFTLIACSIYYDKRGFRQVYDDKYTPQKNEINCAYVGAEGNTIINPDFTKFTGAEYVINDLDQICPYIGAKLERNEYCIIWRDNNFSNNQIINDDLKTLKKKYLNERIRYIKLFSKYNVYPCKTSKEALQLLERKKYNKIILLSNICSNLEGKKFVDNARKILGNDIIVLFVSYNTDHLKWIKNYKNALFSNDPRLVEEYLISFEVSKGIEDKIISLIKKSENYYKVKFNFDNNFLYYPYFKNEGYYRDLTFNI